MAEAAYFLDIAGNEAAKDLDERPSGSAKIYTTLDPRLQQAAEQAIADGMRLVDKALAARHKTGQPVGTRPQVALIALDPHTGEVKALCGGRDYAVKPAQPGAFETSAWFCVQAVRLRGCAEYGRCRAGSRFTPASTVDDSPTTFQFANQTYSPNNFRGEFRGTVTFRQALAHSLNVATVKVGEMVGFDERRGAGAARRFERCECDAVPRAGRIPGHAVRTGTRLYDICERWRSCAAHVYSGDQ